MVFTVSATSYESWCILAVLNDKPGKTTAFFSRVFCVENNRQGLSSLLSPANWKRVIIAWLGFTNSPKYCQNPQKIREYRVYIACLHESNLWVFRLMDSYLWWMIEFNIPYRPCHASIVRWCVWYFTKLRVFEMSGNFDGFIWAVLFAKTHIPKQTEG